MASRHGALPCEGSGRCPFYCKGSVSEIFWIKHQHPLAYRLRAHLLLLLFCIWGIWKETWIVSKLRYVELSKLCCLQDSWSPCVLLLNNTESMWFSILAWHFNYLSWERFGIISRHAALVLGSTSCPSTGSFICKVHGFSFCYFISDSIDG